MNVPTDRFHDIIFLWIKLNLYTGLASLLFAERSYHNTFNMCCLASPVYDREGFFRNFVDFPQISFCYRLKVFYLHLELPSDQEKRMAWQLSGVVPSYEPESPESTP